MLFLGPSISATFFETSTAEELSDPSHIKKFNIATMPQFRPLKIAIELSKVCAKLVPLVLVQKNAASYGPATRRRHSLSNLRENVIKKLPRFR